MAEKYVECPAADPGAADVAIVGGLYPELAAALRAPGVPRELASRAHRAVAGVGDAAKRDRAAARALAALRGAGVGGAPAAAGRPSGELTTVSADIMLNEVPGHVRGALAAFDESGDGVVSCAEIQSAVERYLEVKQSSRRARRLLVVAAGVAVLAMLAVMGLSFAALALVQEQKTDGDGTLRSKATGEVLAAANPDAAVAPGGALRAPGSNATMVMDRAPPRVVALGSLAALLFAEPADLQEIDALVLTINGTNRSLPLGSATDAFFGKLNGEPAGAAKLSALAAGGEIWSIKGERRIVLETRSANFPAVFLRAHFASTGGLGLDTKPTGERVCVVRAHEEAAFFEQLPEIARGDVPDVCARLDPSEYTATYAQSAGVSVSMGGGGAAATAAGTAPSAHRSLLSQRRLADAAAGAGGGGRALRVIDDVIGDLKTEIEDWIFSSLLPADMGEEVEETLETLIKDALPRTCVTDLFCEEEGEDTYAGTYTGKRRLAEASVSETGGKAQRRRLQSSGKDALVLEFKDDIKTAKPLLDAWHQIFTVVKESIQHIEDTAVIDGQPVREYLKALWPGIGDVGTWDELELKYSAPLDLEEDFLPLQSYIGREKGFVWGISTDYSTLAPRKHTTRMRWWVTANEKMCGNYDNNPLLMRDGINTKIKSGKKSFDTMIDDLNRWRDAGGLGTKRTTNRWNKDFWAQVVGKKTLHEFRAGGRPYFTAGPGQDDWDTWEGMLKFYNMWSDSSGSIDGLFNATACEKLADGEGPAVNSNGLNSREQIPAACYPDGLSGDPDRACAKSFCEVRTEDALICQGRGAEICDDTSFHTVARQLGEDCSDQAKLLWQMEKVVPLIEAHLSKCEGSGTQACFDEMDALIKVINLEQIFKIMTPSYIFRGKGEGSDMTAISPNSFELPAKIFEGFPGKVNEKGSNKEEFSKYKDTIYSNGFEKKNVVVDEGVFWNEYEDVWSYSGTHESVDVEKTKVTDADIKDLEDGKTVILGAAGQSSVVMLPTSNFWQIMLVKRATTVARLADDGFVVDARASATSLLQTVLNTMPDQFSKEVPVDNIMWSRDEPLSLEISVKEGTKYCDPDSGVHLPAKYMQTEQPTKHTDDVAQRIQEGGPRVFPSQDQGEWDPKNWWVSGDWHTKCGCLDPTPLPKWHENVGPVGQEDKEDWQMTNRTVYWYWDMATCLNWYVPTCLEWRRTIWEKQYPGMGEWNGWSSFVGEEKGHGKDPNFGEHMEPGKLPDEFMCDDEIHDTHPDRDVPDWLAVSKGNFYRTPKGNYNYDTNCDPYKYLCYPFPRFLPEDAQFEWEDGSGSINMAKPRPDRDFGLPEIPAYTKDATQPRRHGGSPEDPNNVNGDNGDRLPCHLEADRLRRSVPDKAWYPPKRKWREMAQCKSLFRDVMIDPNYMSFSEWKRFTGVPDRRGRRVGIKGAGYRTWQIPLDKQAFTLNRVELMADSAAISVRETSRTAMQSLEDLRAKHFHMVRQEEGWAPPYACWEEHDVFSEFEAFLQCLFDAFDDALADLGSAKRRRHLQEGASDIYIKLPPGSLDGFADMLVAELCAKMGELDPTMEAICSLVGGLAALLDAFFSAFEVDANFDVCWGAVADRVKVDVGSLQDVMSDFFTATDIGEAIKGAIDSLFESDKWLGGRRRLTATEVAGVRREAVSTLAADLGRKLQAAEMDGTELIKLTSLPLKIDVEADFGLTFNSPFEDMEWEWNLMEAMLGNASSLLPLKVQLDDLPVLPPPPPSPAWQIFFRPSRPSS